MCDRELMSYDSRVWTTTNRPVIPEICIPSIRNGDALPVPTNNDSRTCAKSQRETVEEMAMVNGDFCRFNSFETTHRAEMSPPGFSFVRTTANGFDRVLFGRQWSSTTGVCDAPPREDDFSGDTSADRQRTKRAIPSRPLSTEALIHRCAHCQKTFTSVKYLRMHLALHRTWLTDCWGGDQECKGVAVVKPTVKAPTAGGGVTNDTPQWSCNVCGKSFAQNSNYKNHVRTHSEERPFVCDICCIGFKERYHLKKHTLFKHTREMNEQCGQCGKRFKDSTAVRAHERIHSDARPYVCVRCGKAFKTSECLWHHDHRSKTCGRQQQQGIRPGVNGNFLHLRRGTQLQQQQQQYAGGYSAQVSAVNGTNRYAAATHQLMSSPGLISSSSRELEEAGDAATVSRERKACLKQDSTPSSLMSSSSSAIPEFQAPFPTHDSHSNDRQQQNKSKFATKEFSATPTRGLTRVSSKTTTGWTNQRLTVDGDTTSTALSLNCRYAKKHRLESSSSSSSSSLFLAFNGDGKKRAICVMCGKHFVSAPAFDKHMLMHSESRPYRCTVCDIGFKLKVHLKKHNLYRHNEDYPCKCSVCGKRFKDSSAVRLHERIHSNERPFQCQCGKSFKTRENLWGHRHRRPCLKYTLEQEAIGGGGARAKRLHHSDGGGQLPLKPKMETTTIISFSSSSSFSVAPLQSQPPHLTPDVTNAFNGVSVAQSPGQRLEYAAFSNDRKFIADECGGGDVIMTVASEFDDVKPIIASAPPRRRFRETFDDFRFQEISSSHNGMDFDFSSAKSMSVEAYDGRPGGREGGGGLQDPEEEEVIDHRHHQASRSLPPFATLLSALRSCTGDGHSPAAAETSSSGGHFASLPSPNHPMNAGCGGVGAGSHRPPSSSGTEGASVGGGGDRQQPLKTPGSTFDGFPTHQSINRITHQTESVSSGSGGGGGGGRGGGGGGGGGAEWLDYLGEDCAMFGMNSNCHHHQHHQHHHHLPIFYWDDDDQWFDPRFALPNSASWSDADNLLAELAIKPVVGFL